MKRFCVSQLLCVAGLGALLGGPVLAAEPPAVAEPAPQTEPVNKAGQIDKAAQKVIDTYIEAMGGTKAIKAIKNAHMTGSFSMPSAGIKGTTDMYIAGDGRFVQSVTIPGMMTQAAGFDGHYGWTIDPMTGPQLMNEAMLAQLARETDLHAPLHYAKLYQKVTHAGAEDFEGHKADVLELVDRSGEEVKQYFSAESGQMIGQAGQAETQMGKTLVTTVFGEFKEFDHIVLPTKTTIKLGPIEQIVTIDLVETNLKDIGSHLTPPDAVRALIAAEKEKTADDAGG